MLRQVWQWVRDEISAGVIAAGYDDLTSAHIALFRYPTLDGQRPTELAAQMQITKQSVNDLLGQLQSRGYLTRDVDPADGRARVVRLTAKGHRLERIVNDQARAAELAIADLLGPRRFSQLRTALADVAREVSGRERSTTV
jgi:DNA-binding MarR family transcriptional regulator